MQAAATSFSSPTKSPSPVKAQRDGRASSGIHSNLAGRSIAPDDLIKSTRRHFWLLEMVFTKLNYCQYLLSSQINYTLTNLADHLGIFSHDTINRYLSREKLTPRLLWDNVKALIQDSENAYVIFDDTVLDKRYAKQIELTRRQYSGNEHRVVRGIGLVNCVYVNPDTGQFWVIDYRIYDPDGDGKMKLEHVAEMLQGLVYHKQLPWRGALMDSWYATKDLMQYIDRLGKVYYCPLKKNRAC